MSFLENTLEYQNYKNDIDVLFSYCYSVFPSILQKVNIVFLTVAHKCIMQCCGPGASTLLFHQCCSPGGEIPRDEISSLLTYIQFLHSDIESLSSIRQQKDDKVHVSNASVIFEAPCMINSRYPITELDFRSMLELKPKAQCFSKSKMKKSTTLKKYEYRQAIFFINFSSVPLRKKEEDI